MKLPKLTRKKRKQVMVVAPVLLVVLGGVLMWTYDRNEGRKDRPKQVVYPDTPHKAELKDLTKDELKARIDTAEKAMADPANKGFAIDMRLAEYYYQYGDKQKALSYVDQAIKRANADEKIKPQAALYETVKKAITDGKEPAW